MMWGWLAAAATLQLIAGVVRARAWFHVIRHSWRGPTDLRYRDVAVAHLGGVGWNAILPVRSGDAVKVVLVSRRMPERRVALLAATLVPPGLVEAVFTALLVLGVLATGLSIPLPDRGLPVVVAGLACLAVAAAWLFRRRLGDVVGNVLAGLAVLRRPRVLVRCVVPWLLAARGLRLLAYACVLPVAGLQLAVQPALALMALQGAMPSAGAVATAARIAVLAAVLSEAGASDVPAEQVAWALAAAYGVTSTVNVAVSAATVAWLLRTASPRRILAHVRSASRGLLEPDPVAEPASSRD